MMFQKILLVISASLLLTAAITAQGTSTSTTATSSKSARGPVFRANKDQIKQVQAMLKDKKLFSGDASGSLNEDTRVAIKRFQKDNGLKETGTLNRVTLEKFGVELTDAQKAIPVSSASSATPTKDSKPPKATTSTSADAPKRPAPFRANADQIKATQKILKDGKMYAGDETGKLDDATREGLKKYQQANGIKVTGSLNAVTLEKMGIALTDAQKANVAAQAAYDAAKKN